MAGNFAFYPVGITTNITATTGTSTVTVTANPSPSITTGNYQPNGMRLANLGTVAVFVQFGVTAPTVAVGTGMPIFGNTVETFQFRGQNAFAFTSAGTTTLYITPGEGL